MQTTTAKRQQIAKHLNLNSDLIIEVRDFWGWTGGNCWLVVISGKGARFVSKSVTTVSKREVVARALSLVEGYPVAPREIQKVEVIGSQVHFQVRGQLTYCGLDYFRSLVKQQLAA